MSLDLERLERAAGRFGLLLRGAFHPASEDAVPLLADGQAAGTVVLIGNAGAAMWTCFRQSPEAHDGERHAIDRWTRRVVAEIAVPHGAGALFPFQGPPYIPFQRWAKRAEPVFSSPLGMLIHPEYGLWHAYRGALTFPGRLEIPASQAAESPCDSCAEKPCLTTCPVSAFTAGGHGGGHRGGYDVTACRSHVLRPEGVDCLTRGCLARRACPVGRSYLYEPEQASWHMTAFADPNPR